MKKTCWVVTDGKPGMENQALGLAEALEFSITVKRITMRFPWQQLTPYWRWGMAYALSKKRDQLSPPWPHYLIATGRQAILPALYVKRASHGKTKVVYIQNPVLAPSFFDVVVAPAHDQMRGENVIETQGALHRVTAKRLEEEKSRFSFLGRFPSPRLGVLLGGTNRAYRFDEETAFHLSAQLLQLQKQHGASLLISPSRRTDVQSLHILKERLKNSCTFFWDEQGDNPYFAFLAWADALCVTCDSVCMISEAVATSKPVYMVALPGKDAKFSSFHERLLTKGRLRLFEGDIEWGQTALPWCEPLEVADKIKKMLDDQER